MNSISLKEALQYLSVLSLIFYFFGLCYIVIYYYYFDFSVIAFLTSSDILFSEFLILVPIIIIAGVAGYKFVQSSYIFKPKPITLTGWLIFSFGIAFLSQFYLRPPFSSLIFVLMYFLFNMVLLFLDKRPFVTNGGVFPSILFLIVSFASILLLRYYEASKVRRGVIKYDVVYKVGEKTIITNDSTKIYIGSTSDYLFFYSIKQRDVSVVKRANIDSIAIKKISKRAM